MQKSISKDLKNIIDKMHQHRGWLLAVSVIVVFITTYLLILPAFTLEKDEAAKQGGIDVPSVEQTVSADEDAAENDEAVDPEASPEQSETTVPAEVERSDTDGADDSIEAPAVSSEDDSLTFEGDKYTVSVIDNKSALPGNTEVKVSEIDKKTDSDTYKQYYDDALKAVQDDEGGSNVTSFSFARIYDISLVADGEEIKNPDDAVSVRIEYDKELGKYMSVGDRDNLRVIHFAENKNTGEIEPELLDKENIEVNTDKKDNLTDATFETEGFSVFAIVYTVDFSYSVDGETYDYSIDGDSSVSLRSLLQSLNVINDDEDTDVNEVDLFMNEIDTVEFTDSELISIEKADTDEGESADWMLTSLKPFDTEEKLTITMNNGDVFEVKVTDAQEIDDSSSDTIKADKSYLICYEVNGTYYLLKNDGSVDSTHTPADFENLNSTYCWSFNYVFEEKHVEESLDYIYYLIRPIDNKTKTIALNREGQDLVQRSNNNVAVIPAEGGGFKFVGYNGVKLNFDNDRFFADQLPADNLGITVHIYEMDSLPTYSYIARSSDEDRGTVTVSGGTQKTDSDGTYYEAESNSDKNNAGTITAVPVNHKNSELRPGQTGYDENKWIFDHWTQDGIILDRTQYPATINPDTLPIPYNGSKLTAHFRQNPRYVVPDSEKEPSSFEDMTDWLDDLIEKRVPLDEEATQKTAEVYDYENRIYRVDIASKANFRTFKGNVDMAFCMDVSNSMYFPSKLVETASANRSNPMPIYQINDEGRWWSNKGWLDQSRGWNNPYYLIADQSNTATVFKVYFQDGNWKAQDASRETESDKSFIIGDTFETTWTSSETDKTHPFNAGDNDNSTYTIYDAGDSGRNRFYYLNQSFSGATVDLTTIKQVLDVAGDSSPNVRIAYNTFNKELGGQREDFRDVRIIQGLDLTNSHGGGTRPDQAFNDAQNFDWQGDDRYVILITDGAPQGKRDGESLTPEQIVQAARDAAVELKKGEDGIAGTADDVKVITVGLSLDKVPSGKKLLYDIADSDSNGNKMFFMAESASDLPNILRQITDTIMDNAIVYADVTDTVGDAFYPVDKNTGLPLKAGDMIDVDGNLTTDPDQAAGTVQSDGMTIKWNKAVLDPVNGWHGTVFVKAKEDLLGANGVKTNDNAKIEATGYKMDDKEYTFVENPQFENLQSKEVDFPSPRVNVNELQFPNESTEWTVYLGTEVDPEKQLKKMFEDIVVSEVINEDGSLHYPLEPNSIVDRKSGEQGTAKTFALAPEILKAIKEVPSLSTKYVQNGELDWDTFLTDIQKPGGVVVPYKPYGIEGNDSNITITLTKEILEGEETDLVNHSPHDTTVVNNGDTPVEKYVLTVQYNPDYTNMLPPGQGGQGVYNFNTGTYGSMYQGHAAGRETSANTHVINVYKRTVDVLKTGEQGTETLQGASFTLYMKDEQNGSSVEGLNGKYTAVATATTGPDGVATLDSNNENILVEGVTYYLVETAPPQHYQKDDHIWTVEVQTDKSGDYTDLDGNPIYTKDYPFNWDQGARILVDGQPVTVIAKGAEEGQTVTVNDGSYISNGEAISYRKTVVNRGNEITLSVDKEWVKEEDPPESITFELYRVSNIGHKWVNDRVVPCTCTEEGVREYKCSECGKTESFAIDPTGHIPGVAHKENETDPTCTIPGGYDTVVRCKVCNAIISSQHHEEEALGHTPGEPVEENRVAPGCETAGSYDTVVYCTRCDEEFSRETTVIPATGHDWGDWVVTTPAQPGVAGEETRYCKNDPSHTQTRPIDPLPLEHTVTVYLRCRGNGSGGGNYYQTTGIAQRTGTGVGDVTFTWDWNGYTGITADGGDASFTVDYQPNRTYATTEGVQYRIDQGIPKGKRQYVVLSNITQDIIVYITINNQNWAGTSNELVYELQFSGNRSVSSVNTRNALRLSTNTLKGAGPSVAAALLRGAESIPEGAMSSDQLDAHLSSIKTKDEVSCEEAEGMDHTYIEDVGSFTINESDNWTWSANDLPKYNEYGNEYTYYVKETSPDSGYITAYTGQDTGLHDNGEATIYNEKEDHSYEVVIVKVDTGNTNLRLGGAVFDLYAESDVNPDGSIKDGATAINTVTTPSEGTDKGKASLGVLSEGVYYFYETTAPAGYNKLDEPIKITVSNGRVDLVQGERQQTGVIENGITELTVTNTAGAELPFTGGIGTTIFYIIGSLLVITCSVLMVSRRRVKR